VGVVRYYGPTEELVDGGYVFPGDVRPRGAIRG